MSVIHARMPCRWRAIGAALMLCVVAAAYAQSANDPAADPPDRVARLSYLDGDIGLLPAGAQDWGAAEINRPLTRGDKLSSGPDARAELELDGGTLRIDRDTGFGFLELNDDLAQVELTEGTLNLAVRQLDQNQSYEIDTPTVALVVNQPGAFRVDVGANGQSTTVTALDGDATVYGENGAERTVHAGRRYDFRDPALQDVALSDAQGGDDFDAWCSDRDRRYAQSDSRRYVSDDVVGYQDLDRYGDWQNNADYGQVWYPSNVASDWAPYRDGHWSYIAPWGWTWVDDSPWGFAPYHYGRWAYVGHAWGWIPGPTHVRPIYAPALVAFVGGRGWSASIGLGDAPVGWFPLGPGEVYNPWYRSSRRYYTQVNVTNINVRNRTVIINRIDRQYGDYRRGVPVRGEHYVNRNAPRGFTAVPGRSFVGAQRVKRDLLHVDPRQLAAAPMLGSAATPRPTPRSLEPPGPTRAGARARQGFEREVVARHAPPPAFAARAIARQPGGHAQATAPVRPSQVRLLAGHGATLPSVHRIEPVSPQPVARQIAGRAAPLPGTRSAATRPAAPARGAPLDRNPPPARGAGDAGPDELPSARFVRARREALSGRDSQQTVAAAAPRDSRPQRPGVSYISSNPRERQSPAAPLAGTASDSLPPSRHFERASPAQVAEATRMNHNQDARRPSTSGVRDDGSPPQRFGQDHVMGHNLRAPDFNRLPPAGERPLRVDRPPPGYQLPNGREPPRLMPHGFAPPMRAAGPTAPAAQSARRTPAPSRQDKLPRKGEPQH
jgi:hypothetical protein